MRQLLSSRFALVVACTLLGCTTSKRTLPLVQAVHTDTRYLSSRQFDSIYIFRDRTTDYRQAKPQSDSYHQLSGSCSLPLGSYDRNAGLCNRPPDTLVIHETLTEYRYRLLHDTM